MDHGSPSTIIHAGLPLGLEKLEKWEGISSQGKSGNFEQTGKFWENLTKYWKTQGISDTYFFSDI